MTSFSFFKYFDAFELDVNVVSFVYYGKTRQTLVRGNLLDAGKTVEYPLHVQDLKAIDKRRMETYKQYFQNYLLSCKYVSVPEKESYISA